MFKFNEEGIFKGDCLVRVINDKQVEHIQNAHLKKFGHRYIEVLESTVGEWEFTERRQIRDARTKYKGDEDKEKSGAVQELTEAQL